MTHVLRKSLLVAALAVVSMLSASTVNAQRVENLLDAENGPALGTRLFAGTVDDIPGPRGDGFADAFYDPATGDVFVSFGSEVILLGINGEPVLGENLTTDIGAFGQLPAAGGQTGQNDESGVGFLRTSGLVQSFDPAVGIVALPAGPINLGALLPAGLTTPEAFNAAFNQTDSAASVFFSVGVNAGVDPNNGGVQGFQILSAIPEPGSLSLLALSALGCVARRRR